MLESKDSLKFMLMCRFFCFVESNDDFLCVVLTSHWEDWR